jgi:hypothetical protein
MKIRFAPLVAAALFACSAPAYAWGTKGHTIVNHLAALSFVGRMPAFLTTPSSMYEIAYLGPEMDDLKDSGESWDADYDTGHFLDVMDDGTIAGVVKTDAMPKNRQQYNNALETAHTNEYQQGYLPYEMLDGWEQLRKDFAYWRVDDYLSKHGATPSLRLRGQNDRLIEESLIRRDLGVWGHFVGDGCQPLHVTVHFNGWGKYPNPNGYTTDPHTHSMFESAFVNRFLSEGMVAKLMKPQSAFATPNALLSQETVMASIMQYLLASAQTVPHLYDIEKAGGFAKGMPEAVSFTASRLATGAMELRDLSVLAWQDSLHETVGYPNVAVQDILSGKAPWPQKPAND